MPDIAAHEPLPPEDLVAWPWAWATVDDDDRPVAYVLVGAVDGCGHIEQISVHPDVARRGVGRGLVDTVAVWAATEGLAALTLITFRDVPWNRPYYERIGFRMLADDELGPGLAALRDAEVAKGLDPTRRVCMRRDL